MKLFYSDHSGDPSFYSRNNFCVAALVMNNNNMSVNTKEFDRLLRIIHQQIWIPKKEITFTASDILRGRGIYSAVNLETRMWIMEQITKSVSKMQLDIIAVLLDKELIWWENWYWSGGSKWAKDWIWKLYLEKITDYSALEKQKGIIVFQSLNTKANLSFESYLKGIISGNDHYIKPQYLEAIQFFPKYQEPMLQVADVIAWTIRRRYRTDTPNQFLDVFAHELFQLLEPKFAQRPDGSVRGYGMKIFPSLLPGPN